LESRRGTTACGKTGSELSVSDISTLLVEALERK
jgi:hypothetical protein